MWLIQWMLTALLALGVGCSACVALAEPPQFTPTGQFITPGAAPGAMFEPLNPHLAGDPSYTAGQASAVALSPDGRTLLILTSGYNLYFGKDGKQVPTMSEEYVFVFDVSGPRPVQRQAILVPNTFLGVAWAPLGDSSTWPAGSTTASTSTRARDRPLRRWRAPSSSVTRPGSGLAVKPEAGALGGEPRRRAAAWWPTCRTSSVTLIDLTSRRPDRAGLCAPA